jgi:hypothetical protein
VPSNPMLNRFQTVWCSAAAAADGAWSPGSAPRQGGTSGGAGASGRVVVVSAAERGVDPARRYRHHAASGAGTVREGHRDADLEERERRVMRRWPRPCSKGRCLRERVVHLAPVDLEGGERGGGGGRWKERSCGSVALDGEKGERRGELAWQTDEFHGADSGTADRRGETFVAGAVVSGRGRTSHGRGQDDVARGCRIAGRTMAHVDCCTKKNSLF